MNIAELIQSAFHSYQTGNLRQTEHFCTKILQEQPDNEEIIYLLGIVYAQLEEYDSAIKNIERLLQLNPEQADAYLALGGIYQQKGLLDESVHCYDRAIEIDLQLTEAYENLGDIFRNNHQLDEAVRQYKKALQCNPAAAEIYLNMGNIFKEKGQYDLAMFYYRTAMRHKSDYAEAYNSIGILYYEQDRLDEAIAYYQKALKINPDLTDARVHLENAVREKKQFHEAVYNYANWLGINIKLGFFKIQMLINAVINQFYFRTMNVQFHPDILHDENVSSGLKRRILEKIFGDTNKIEKVSIFNDLDRLNAIKQYFENPAPETLSCCPHDNTVTGHNEDRGAAVYDKIHHEFLSIATRIETRLVKILNSRTDFHDVSFEEDS